MTRGDVGGESAAPEGETFAPTSELLARLREGGERLTLAEVAEATRGRAFGLIFLLLALPETIPMIGLSAILGTPIVLLGAFMVWSGSAARLPGWLGRRSIKRAIAVRAIDRSARVIDWLDRATRPRWGRLATASRMQGAVCVLMGILLAVPVPGVNILAAFAVAGTGLGILQRDGLLVAAAMVSAVLALIAMAAIATGLLSLVEGLVGR